MLDQQKGISVAWAAARSEGPCPGRDAYTGTLLCVPAFMFRAISIEPDYRCNRVERSAFLFSTGKEGLTHADDDVAAFSNPSVFDLHSVY